MNLENVLFKKNYHYKAQFINKCILIIKCSNDEKRIKAYKNFVFRMMKDIVKKNVSNYINLLRGSNCPDIPERDELITDCYIIFDICLKKYKVRKKYNFYFYFNKSLSRNFFRCYQNSLKNGNVELTEAIVTVHPKLKVEPEEDTISVLINNMNFSELEKRVVYSKLEGKKTSEFLKENPDVNNSQYSKALKIVKEKLIVLQNKGEL